MSDDGRYVAFESLASNLVSGDTNGFSDVFVRDHQLGTTERVSVSSSGVPSNSLSLSPAISSDGRYVAFYSRASNLVSGDTNGLADVFVHDRATGETTRVSTSSSGVQAGDNSYAPAISGDGRYVAFESLADNLVTGDTNEATDVFLHDRDAGTTIRLSRTLTAQGNDDSNHPSMSRDGRYITFWSRATNLVSGDTNGQTDVFIRNRGTGATSRVSVSTAGAQANAKSSRSSLSRDGRYVAFESDASNLVSGDTNGGTDVFVRDRTAGTTTRVSVNSGGAQATGSSTWPSISGDGRLVAFSSGATNLVFGDTNGVADVFLKDRTTRFTRRVSLDSDGAQASGGASMAGSISDDAKYVAFNSDAANLVGGDTNSRADAFLRYSRSPGPLVGAVNEIARGTTGDVVIAGSWFDAPKLRVALSANGGITVNRVTVVNNDSIVIINVTVAASGEVGDRDVSLYNLGNPWNPYSGAGDTCTDCLTVT